MVVVCRLGLDEKEGVPILLQSSVILHLGG